MISELFLQDLSLWSCVWQSTLLLMIGLAGSFLLRRRPARAFQVLFVAMMATVAVPVMSVLVKHFEIGAFVAEPVALKPVSMDLPQLAGKTSLLDFFWKILKPSVAFKGEIAIAH